MSDIFPRPKVLAVDDEAFNLDIIGELLEDAGYEVFQSTDGEAALCMLEDHLDIDVIVLDRMMPRMDGMTCLSRLKDDPRFAHIPVIMQTAAASHEQVRQGIDGGVFYYLTKPYDEAVLVSLVRAALAEGRQKAALKAEVHQNKHIMGLMRGLQFRFRTLSEARALAIFIANCFPTPERVVYGLSELMINAIEHGNLSISYAEKTNLVLNNCWQEEVERRLSLPEQLERYCEISLEAASDKMSVKITDLGEGFDFEKFLDISPERATDPHGRGIATARLISFDTLSYSDSGRTVTCFVNNI
ncbi:ATP-binding response regulator [Asticcacaulis benevestitus]|uniref:Response regulatory domain-containing protein n=1 Tax=Asticcacaulis benevestitus DSM 16100 = ATCC BAA-896 TaxID=1121022 RepID=V4PFP6_9CAUL|nr:response regulator [Asticcacaulis benevestitus]ESQ92802.1 hypothetical protein ABENE_06790 [Asticcacaulis benevestitus DSM 16100 = ATCC BAA-896]